MHYFIPGNDLFLGDCMPFFDGTTFHLFYLLDEGHHQGLGGLGGHQWAHATTTDLVDWQHQPLALPISEPWEGSICTGSVVYDQGQYHAFYAVRKRDRTQHLGHAVSSDGVTFHKTEPNPFLSPPAAYVATDFRDPHVFADSNGRWHMLVTSRLARFPLDERGGCLVHLTSDDLWQWTIEEPLLVPGGAAGYPSIPECPDYFVWNGWHYLVFGLGLQTHYRMARQFAGPWLRPPIDILDSHLCAVIKTAPFGADRRIGVGWSGPRRDNRDDGSMLWGGNAVFREVIQHTDGTLGIHFVPELARPSGTRLELSGNALTEGSKVERGRVELHAQTGQEVAAFDAVPRNCSIRCRVEPTLGSARFGLGLRGSGRFATSYDLSCFGHTGSVTLGNERIDGIRGLDQPFTLEVILYDDIIDVCIDGRFCLINRFPERNGDALFMFCENGMVVFDDIDVRPIT